MGDEVNLSDQQLLDYLYSPQFDPVQYQTEPIDYGGGVVVNPDNTVNYTGPIGQLWGALKGGDWTKLGSALKGIFDPKGSYGALGLAGLAGLMNQSNFFNPPPEKVGFQGTIPEMTATRTQTPAAQQRPADYRPGQGGITYFNPTQYTPKAAGGGEMHGGINELAQGRFLRGGGDGVSDSIPAQFAGSGKPARLADGEFVVPARVVSELGNGSSEAGARKLYAMMDRVERAGKKAKRGGDSHADKHLPA